MSTLLQLDWLSTLLITGTSLSVVYAYKSALVQNGLIGIAYLDKFITTKPFEMPTINVCSKVENETIRTQCISLFPHIDTIHFASPLTEVEDELTPQQYESLKMSLYAWNILPLDNGVQQHICLYNLIKDEFGSFWKTSAFPSAIKITCNKTLIELTNTPFFLECDTSDTADSFEIYLRPDTENVICWPNNVTSTPEKVEPSPASTEAQESEEQK
jgi:hypothetical protein